MLLMGVSTLYSCKDDDDVSATSEREFMTMFRLNENTGKGEYPNDDATLKQLVQGISHYNAKRYFGI